MRHQRTRLLHKSVHEQIWQDRRASESCVWADVLRNHLCIGRLWAAPLHHAALGSFGAWVSLSRIRLLCQTKELLPDMHSDLCDQCALAAVQLQNIENRDLKVVVQDAGHPLELQSYRYIKY